MQFQLGVYSSSLLYHFVGECEDTLVDVSIIWKIRMKKMM